MILFLLTLIPVVATATLYGWLESCANMVEMLLFPFTPQGKTAAGALVVGGPFLVLFIALGAGVVIAVPLAASSIAACLAGWLLNRLGHCISVRSAWLAIALGAVLTMLFVVVASHHDSMLLMGRPASKPKTSASVLACVAGGNAALSLFVATWILRCITSPRQPPPIPPSGSSDAA